MEKALSLCIPAYNEGRCIGTGLDSALSQSFDGNVDIAVCANGCTDNTADVVRKYSARYPNISLIETGERGKPNAWNLLRRRAKHNVVIFGDGDVYFDRDAFAFLYDDVMNGGKVVYGARCVPALDKVDRVTRFFDMGSDYYQHCLIGKLYAFDNSKLQETLE
jgi:glycosyltransferase involved in cell wall biosynthesis